MIYCICIYIYIILVDISHPMSPASLLEAPGRLASGDLRTASGRTPEPAARAGGQGALEKLCYRMVLSRWMFVDFCSPSKYGGFHSHGNFPPKMDGL